MKRAHLLAVLMVLSLSIYGSACRDGSSGPDASEACEDLCDAAADCEFDGFDAGACSGLCDEIDDGEDDVSGNCEEAIAELLECASGVTCEALENIDEIEDAGELITLELENCLDEAEQVRDECEDEL